MAAQNNFRPVAIVTDVHYRMSLALIRDLGQAGVAVITCERGSYQNDPASPALGSLSRHCSRHFWLPEDGYMQALLELCRGIGSEYQCKPALLPVGADTLGTVASHREEFDAVAGLLIPSSHQLDWMNDKARVGQLAGSLGVPVPGNFEIDPSGEFSHLPMPCVIKPLCGEKLGLAAAQRYVIAGTPQQAKAHYDRFTALSGQPPLVQTYLPGSGLGCSVLASEGKVLAAIAHRRMREYPVSGGPSSCCVSIDPAPFLPWVEKMVAHTGYSGLAMFEFKEDAAGKPHLLEVNPRIWGTFPLTRVCRSGMAVLWFTVSWNRGNPALPVPASSPVPGRKMIFCASDLMSAVGYARKGRIGKSLMAAADLLNPFVRDGLFEWRDPAPAMAYFRSLIQKEKHP